MLDFLNFYLDIFLPAIFGCTASFFMFSAFVFFGVVLIVMYLITGRVNL